MPPPDIFILARPVEKLFLEDYFSDTRSRRMVLDPKTKFDIPEPANAIFFVDLSLVNKGSLKNLSLLQDREKARVFALISESLPPGSDLPDFSRLALPIVPSVFEETVLKAVEIPPEIRVLVVDDEPELCAGIKDYLESRRHPAFLVECASNGLEAFGKIDKFRPDVTLLDLKMPVKSGHEFYREVQKRYPGFRVIVLTSSVGAEEIEGIRKSGMPPMVEKGSRRSSFSEIASLIKKVRVFS